MSSNSLPPDWRSDSLSEFLDCANRNVLATFQNLRQEFNGLALIDQLFRDMIENLTQSSEILSGFLLFRSHSSFRGATVTALSGQLAETYMLLRGALESALYGLYVANDTNRQEIWLRRHDDEVSKRRMQKEFTVKNVRNHLKTLDAKTHHVATTLYEQTIDYGGHPNEHAVMTQVKIQSTGTRHDFQADYFVCGNLPHQLAIKTAAQVGICCLDIFYLVFRDRYRILGIDQRLDETRKGF